MFSNAIRQLNRPLLRTTTRSLLTQSTPSKPVIKIVEVGPRDGLQNEKSILSASIKVDLIENLVKVGLMNVESGSFVAPKWVPQMASTTEVHLSPVLRQLRTTYSDALNFPILVPNQKGWEAFLALRSLDPSPLASSAPISNEIAVFVAASESFSHANLNCSIYASIQRLVPVIKSALEHGVRVRGYISTVIGCPFEGAIDPQVVRKVAKELRALGCYEISLGDTIGAGTPEKWTGLIQGLKEDMHVSVLAAHCHDSFGTGIACILALVEAGITTVDSSISGLGGCPYSPGATGNVATEDVIYALESSGFSTGVLPLPASPSAPWDDLLVNGSERNAAFVKVSRVGRWISQELGRENGSRAGKAVLARKEREDSKKPKL